MISHKTTENNNIISIAIEPKMMSLKLTIALRLNLGGEWIAKQTFVHSVNDVIIEQLVKSETKPIVWREAAKLFNQLDISKYNPDL